MTRTVGTVIVGVLAIACDHGPRDPAAATAALIGRYELYVGPNQPRLRVTGAEVLSEVVTLRADGRYEQACTFKNQPSVVTEGRWNYDGGVHFERLSNCSGFLGQSSAGAASLVVEFNRPPIILLDPDLNVFYEQKPQRSSGG